jgi:hypothetical protein
MLYTPKLELGSEKMLYTPKLELRSEKERSFLSASLPPK